jgi:hypothetical protein
MPPKKKKPTADAVENFLNVLIDVSNDGETSLPPTFVCQNQDHIPHHVAVGLAQKKSFNDAFGCKKWKPVKSA